MNWKDYLSYSAILRRTVVSLLLVFIIVCNIHSQTEPDTLSPVQNEDSEFVMEKSPWGAVLRSALVPGFGQYYNESYWKIPVFLGFFGYYLSGWIRNNDNYITYRDLYTQSLIEGNENTRYQRLRDFYVDQRDKFAIYIGITYFLNLVDAYVDAHLFDFNVEEDPNTNSTVLNMRFYIF